MFECGRGGGVFPYLVSFYFGQNLHITTRLEILEMSYFVLVRFKSEEYSRKIIRGQYVINNF